MADQQFPHDQRRKKKKDTEAEAEARSCSLMKGVSTSAWFNNPVKNKSKSIEQHLTIACLLKMKDQHFWNDVVAPVMKSKL
jgi:hypothetical protein